MAQVFRLNAPDKFVTAVATTNEQKDNIWIISKMLGCRKDSVKLVGTTEVSRIANHKVFLKLPLRSQWITSRIDRYNRLCRCTNLG